MSQVRQTLSVPAASGMLLAVGWVFEKLVPLVAPDIPPQFQAYPALYRDWPGWTETYMIVHPLVYGIPFAIGFLVLRRTTGDGWQGGLKYGLGVFALGALPVWLLMYASVRVSPEVMLSFVVRSVCQYAAAGVAVGAVAGRLTSPASSP